MPSAAQSPKNPGIIVEEAEAQWIFTSEELACAPSIMDGMTQEAEFELRSKGLNFIMQVGIMLKLPQSTISTGCIFFNRFLMRNSLVSKPDQPKALHHYQIAAVALFLASKAEENCRKLKEVIVACCRIAQKNPSLNVDEQDKDFWRWRDTLLFNEDVMLETLCFDVNVESAHKVLYAMLKDLSAEHNKDLRTRAWAILNDTFQTVACLLFTSRTVAATSIYMAARLTEPETTFVDDEFGRPWWKVQNVEIKQMRTASNFIVDLYVKKQTPDANLYVGLRTPEHDGEDDARTRLRRSPQVPQSPTEWTGPADVGPPETNADNAAPQNEVNNGSGGGAVDADADQGREEGELDE